MLANGLSPAKKLQREKQTKNNDVFGYWLVKRFTNTEHEASTRDNIGGIIKRDVAPKFGKLLLPEIMPTILR